MLLTAAWLSGGPAAAQDPGAAGVKESGRARAGEGTASGKAKLVAVLNADTRELAKGHVPGAFLHRYQNGGCTNGE